MTKYLLIKLTKTNNQAKWFLAGFGKSLKAHYPSLLQPTEFLATPI